MQLGLEEVGETALIPLVNRACETRRKKPRVKDEKADQIVRALDIDTKKFDKVITHECVIARTIMFDEKIKELLQGYPDAVCVNMGCGLDDRYERVDNGQLTWYDVDLPDSIKVRKKVYEETPRRHMVGADLLEGDWIDTIKKKNGSDQPVVFIAEGLFMYFQKEQTKKLLRQISSAFEKGVLVVELMRPSMMNENLHETVKYTNAKFGWGTNSGRELEEICPKIKLVSEGSFSKQMMRSTLLSRVIGFATKKVNNRLAVFAWG